jgi:hypothetical protein
MLFSAVSSKDNKHDGFPASSRAREQQPATTRPQPERRSTRPGALATLDLHLHLIVASGSERRPGPPEADNDILFLAMANCEPSYTPRDGLDDVTWKL